MAISKRSYEIISHALWQMRFPVGVNADSFLAELQQAREDVAKELAITERREPPADLSLDAKIKWFEEWVSDHAKKPSALEAEDYADMFDVINAAKGRISGVSKEGEAK